MMNLKTVHRGKVDKGHFIPDNLQRYKQVLWSFEKKRIMITIQKEFNKRTLAQNDYLHAYLTIIADETGHTMTEIKELCKELFLPHLTKEICGHILIERGSTTELEKDGSFSEFIERISAEFGIIPPDPKEYLYQKHGECIPLTEIL